jgi:hypothetical protein
LSLSPKISQAFMIHGLLPVQALDRQCIFRIFNISSESLEPSQCKELVVPKIIGSSKKIYWKSIKIKKIEGFEPGSNNSLTFSMVNHDFTINFR